MPSENNPPTSSTQHGIHDDSDVGVITIDPRFRRCAQKVRIKAASSTQRIEVYRVDWSVKGSVPDIVRAALPDDLKHRVRPVRIIETENPGIFPVVSERFLIGRRNGRGVSLFVFVVQVSDQG